MSECADFVFQPMLTCIGNKRKLVGHIGEIFEDLRLRIGKPRLNIVDGFSGSSVVSRQLSRLADNIYVNDMELYAYLMSICFLVTPSAEQETRIRAHLAAMNSLAEDGPLVEGIMCKLYAPRDSSKIKIGERCFYTRENALVIDTMRAYIGASVEPDIFPYCVTPVLVKASIHANTAGVFKGFYKSGSLGHFGGAGENALSRILKPIRVDVPVWSREPFKAVCTNLDINSMVRGLPGDIDVMYLDPPYNQHPYSSNYFMLNVIATNVEPTTISAVSGIPSDWNRSAFNKRGSAVAAVADLIAAGLEKSNFLVLSYNNEGVVKCKDWDAILEPYFVEKREISYAAYKGSRNLKGRDAAVTEIMYIVSLKLKK